MRFPQLLLTWFLLLAGVLLIDGQRPVCSAMLPQCCCNTTVNKSEIKINRDAITSCRSSGGSYGIDASIKMKQYEGRITYNRPRCLVSTSGHECAMNGMFGGTLNTLMWPPGENSTDIIAPTGDACLFIPECPSPELPPTGQRNRDVQMTGFDSGTVVIYRGVP